MTLGAIQIIIYTPKRGEVTTVSPKGIWGRET